MPGSFTLTAIPGIVSRSAELVFDLLQSPEAGKAHALASTESRYHVGRLIFRNDSSKIVHKGADVHRRPSCEHYAVLREEGHELQATLVFSLTDDLAGQSTWEVDQYFSKLDLRLKT